MALKPPGSRSNLELIVYLALVTAQVAIMIGGNLLLAWIVLSWFGLGDGLDAAAAFTGLPRPALILAALAAVALDGWVL